MKGYCFKCKAQRLMRNEKKSKMKNGRHALKGLCSKCGTKMFKFVKG